MFLKKPDSLLKGTNDIEITKKDGKKLSFRASIECTYGGKKTVTFDSEYCGIDNGDVLSYDGESYTIHIEDEPRNDGGYQLLSSQYELTISKI